MINRTYPELAIQDLIFNATEIAKHYETQGKTEVAGLLFNGIRQFTEAFSLVIPFKPVSQCKPNEVEELKRSCYVCRNCISTFPHSDMRLHKKGCPTTGLLECEAGENMNLREPCPKFEQRSEGEKHRVVYR